MYRSSCNCLPRLRPQNIISRKQILCKSAVEDDDEDEEQPCDLWRPYKGNGEDKIFIDLMNGKMNALHEVQQDMAEAWRRAGDEIAKRLKKALGEMYKWKQADQCMAPGTKMALEQNRK